MDSRATLGLGQGMMQGLELYRRHSREDEQDEQRRDQLARDAQRHDLSMRRGEQDYSQRGELFPGQLEQQGLRTESLGLGNQAASQSIDQNAQLFPERLEGMQLGNQASRQSINQNAELHPLRVEGMQTGNDMNALSLDNAEFRQPYEQRALQRQDVQGEQMAWAQDVSFQAQQAVQRALQGDINALNEFSAATNPDNPDAPMVLPSNEPGMVVYRANGQDQVVPLDAVIKRTAELANPQVVIDRALSPNGNYSDVEYRDGVGYGQLGPDNKWNPINTKNAGARGAGGAGGGLTDSGQSLVERMSRQYWGNLNAEGAFMVPEDARDSYLLTQQRAIEMSERGIPLQTAVNYAALSISGPLSDEDAIQEAEEELMEGRGLMDARPSESEVRQLAAEIQAESQQAAQIYQQLTGGGYDSALGGGQPAPTQGLSMQAPQTAASANGPGSAARNTPQQPPLIESEADYEALPSGAQFVNPADGKTYVKP